MAKTTFTSIDDYIASQPEATQAALRRVRAAIRKALPKAEEAIAYSIAAFKVEEKNGKWQLTPAWLSRDMNRAEPPVIANGIIFTYGNGEDTDQAAFDIGLAYNNAAQRIKGSTHAVLYALDATNGKELYNSGKQITSFVHFGALSVANGRVYLGTYDSNLYSFGLPGK